MARRRTATTTRRRRSTPGVKRSGNVVVVSPPAAAARTRVRRTVKRVARSAGTLQGRMTTQAIAGYLLALGEKYFGDQIPAIPVVGRKGAIALGVGVLKPKNKYLQDIGIVAAGISGYEFGRTGAITGDYDDWSPVDD